MDIPYVACSKVGRCPHAISLGQEDLYSWTKPKLSGSKVFPSGLVKDKLDQMSSHTSEDSATAQDEQMAYPR